MSKDILQKLRKENDDLKSDITDLKDELKQLKSKKATCSDNQALQDSVPFLSYEYDERQ